ncbi:MAG: pilin [bacterium]
MNNDAAKLSDIGTYFGNILTAMMPLLGMIAFIMLLVGGFKIMTAGGDTKAAQSGKDTLTYAVIGIVLSLVAWLVLAIIENLTGAKVTQFKLSF